MFDPHAQGIRNKQQYQRDGPFVAHIDASKELAPQRLWKGQAETTVSKDLGHGHHIHIFHNVLEEKDRISYLQNAENMKRIRSSFKTGHISEIHYTRDGSTPSYANVNQQTAVFPQHILSVSDKIKKELLSTVSENPYTVLESAVDMALESSLSNGGSLGLQSGLSAVPMIKAEKGQLRSSRVQSAMLGCVALVSFGQTRWIRVSKKEATGTMNIAMPDNSVLLLQGSGFQDVYQHQIDELPPSHPIGTHLLLKLRYREPGKYNLTPGNAPGHGPPSSRAWMKTDRQ